MSYAKQTWSDGSTGGTPLSATRLQHVEDGLAAVDTAVSTHAASTSDVHAAAKYAIMPDGGRNIWTRDTDPGGLAQNGDIWIAPL